MLFSFTHTSEIDWMLPGVPPTGRKVEVPASFIMREIHAREGVMDHRRPIIQTIADAESIRAQILAGAARTADWLRSFTGDPIGRDCRSARECRPRSRAGGSR
jgi:hypothetical protein